MCNGNRDSLGYLKDELVYGTQVELDFTKGAKSVYYAVGSSRGSGQVLVTAYDNWNNQIWQGTLSPSSTDGTGYIPVANGRPLKKFTMTPTASGNTIMLQMAYYTNLQC